MNNDVEAALRALGHDKEAAMQAAVRFQERAAADGLADVAYATVDSPAGRLLAAVTRKGLARLAFGNQDADAVLEDLSRRLSPRVVEAPAKLDDVRRQLDEYFAGSRRDFTVPLDWALMRGFAKRVLEATHRIPYGSVSTYRDVATAAGNPRASRAAGNALGGNPIAIVVPCHRVLRTGGALGGYGGGLPVKQLLLDLEGA